MNTEQFTEVNTKQFTKVNTEQFTKVNTEQFTEVNTEQFTKYPGVIEMHEIIIIFSLKYWLFVIVISSYMNLRISTLKSAKKIDRIKNKKRKYWWDKPLNRSSLEIVLTVPSKANTQIVTGYIHMKSQWNMLKNVAHLI